MKNNLGAGSILLVHAVFSLSVFAADPPGPGQIFQQQQVPAFPPGPAEPRKPVVDEKRENGDAKPLPISSATRRVLVRNFRITGLTVAPEASVQTLLEAHRNRESTIVDLHKAATVVQQYLRGLGYFARVYVPTQDVRNGVVELRVVESRIDRIDIQKADGLRVDDETLRKYFGEPGQYQGRLLRQDRIEREVLLLGDLAGVRASAMLVPGGDQGNTTVVVSAVPEPPVEGFVLADNTGNKYTGRERLDADVRINSPLRLGDHVSIRGAVSRHSEFARVAYTIPVTATGLSLGAAYSLNTYKLCCDFAALDQRGWAQSASFFATYPITRSIARNLSISLIYTDKRIVGNALGALASDHRVTSWSPGLYGDWIDEFAGSPARSTWSVQASMGRLDLSSSPDSAPDAATAATSGRFQKMLFHFARVQKIGQDWGLQASARGQLAGKNLDSSEKIFLGGVSGVRAYPTGEAIGDSAVILNAELQRSLAPKLTGSLFVDYGHVQLHDSPWANWQAGNSTIQNKYSLAGAGLGAIWQPARSLTFRALIAAPIGSNPGRDVNGRNSENGRNGARLWVAMSWGF